VNPNQKNNNLDNGDVGTYFQSKLLCRKKQANKILARKFEKMGLNSNDLGLQTVRYE